MAKPSVSTSTVLILYDDFLLALQASGHSNSADINCFRNFLNTYFTWLTESAYKHDSHSETDWVVSQNRIFCFLYKTKEKSTMKKYIWRMVVTQRQNSAHSCNLLHSLPEKFDTKKASLVRRQQCSLRFIIIVVVCGSVAIDVQITKHVRQWNFQVVLYKKSIRKLDFLILYLAYCHYYSKQLGGEYSEPLNYVRLLLNILFKVLQDIN